jgi:alpha-N-acetylglucosaminidase
MQVTVWGGPELFDYANKEWAGLNEDFIRGRWALFFGALDSAPSLKALKLPDFAKWELNWALSTRPIAESKPEDPLKVCDQVLKTWADRFTERSGSSDR